jgi:ribonuclease HI
VYVIRDDQGAVKKAGAGSEPFLQNAFHAELLGCLEGLKMAVQLGTAHVVVETDAQLVKGAIEGEDYRLSSFLNGRYCH